MADDQLAQAAGTSSSQLCKAEFSDRVLVRSILSQPEGGAELDGHRVRIGGWVKNGRKANKGAFAFLHVNDGSCPENLQVIVDADKADLGRLVHAGTCVHVDGFLKIPPAGTQQKVELWVQNVLHLRQVDDPATYPLPKKYLTPEYLREVDAIHLRPRTDTFSSVLRIRDALTYATHTFFHKHHFLCVHTPIITSSDCEGAGEMFQVTTLFSQAEKLVKELIKNPPPSESDVEAAKLIVKEKVEVVSKLKSDDKTSKEEIDSSVTILKKAKEGLLKLEKRSKLKPGIPQKDGKIDYSLDFFARKAYLTVSGQLQIESVACALSSVYTFGPTFRAEHSHTSRHLAEFWMVEPEIAFADLEDDMNCAEAYVQFLCRWLLDNCIDDLKSMADKFDKSCIDRLTMISSSPFERITYTKAVELLEEAVKMGKVFENQVEWGIDLASEHERYLTEVKFQKPVIVYNYPKGIKAFYMRLNDDSDTVAAMDVLVPKVGELIGGSQREERYDKILKRIREMGMSTEQIEQYKWYLDLRKFGTVKHSGFGLGFERMVMFATGIDNIRDVIPFPRYPGRADV
ncbi:asparagine--tRNA ligase, cytoplasmic 1 [Ziziphus jujuba]|uniref:asparagine--tRNA ligase n=1 Tax=Ziziphus jujuba TaxID=326968 RepID=A0ABM3ZUU8_ZIZJJ|nr:asparagine--tRNA ligase, cytoplasmic 1 [Ziziphus jujuba]